MSYLHFSTNQAAPQQHQLQAPLQLRQFIRQSTTNEQLGWIMEQLTQLHLDLQSRKIALLKPDLDCLAVTDNQLLISEDALKSYANQNWISQQLMAKRSRKYCKHQVYLLANQLDIKSKNLFCWDDCSDQPHVIRAPQFKRRVRLWHWPQHLKMLLSSLAILPLAAACMPLFKRRKPPALIDCIGIGVNLDKGNQQQELVEELGIKHLIIRVFMHDLDNLDAYVEFAKSFNHHGDKSLLIMIAQDREHVEDLQLSREAFRRIFSAFAGVSHEFQIGTTINRLKWGFYCVDEYLDFYQQAEHVRNQEFKHLRLLGPSVIDFEYYYTVSALFNLRPVRFDAIAALLYVDRRGAPSNKQYLFFDTHNKIRLLNALTRLSPKAGNKEIYLTEANWPIKNTAPYSPTSEKECVSNEEYCQHMLEYLTTAVNSGMVKRVYWHQLIAPGYGLVDNRDGELVKYPQFDALKQLLNTDQGAS